MNWAYIKASLAIENIINKSQVKCIYKNKEYIFNGETANNAKISLGMLRSGSWYVYTYSL